MTKKKFAVALLAIALAGLGMSIIQTRAASPGGGTPAVESWTQTLMTDVASGPQAKGGAVLQVGEVNTISASIAGTRTKVVTAPSSGSTYLRGLFIEKAATSTGAITVSYGTGTNCGTNNTVILTLAAAASQVLPFGYQPIGSIVPAGKDLCLATEGSNTAVRALAQ